MDKFNSFGWNVIRVALIYFLLMGVVKAQEVDPDIQWCSTVADISALAQVDRVKTDMSLYEYLDALDRETNGASDRQMALIKSIAVNVYNRYRFSHTPRYVRDREFEHCMTQRKQDIPDLSS